MKKQVLFFFIVIFCIFQSPSIQAKSIDNRVKRGIFSNVASAFGSIVQKPFQYIQCRVKSRLGVCIDEFFGRDCKGKFQCQNRECVDLNSICNGTPQCKDSSDEFPQICEQIQKTGQNHSVPEEGTNISTVPSMIPSTNRPNFISESTEEPQKQDQQGEEGCVLPPYPDNGKWVVPQVPNAQPQGIIPYYSVLKYMCAEGYDLKDPGNGVHICMEEKWLEVQPVCVLSEKKVDDLWNQYLNQMTQ